MRQPRALPPEFELRPFTTREAADAGLTRRRTRSQQLSRPFRGIRSVESPSTTRDLCHAYAARMPASHFFSHLTAGRLHGLPLPSRLERDATLQVTATSPSRPPRMAGVEGHLDRTGHTPVEVRGGLRMASPIATWCQLATVLTLDELVIVGDALVRRKRPLATVPELEAAVRAWAGNRGSRRLREALELIRPGVDSPRETIIRLMIVRAGLPAPEVNAKIFNANGAFIAFGDMVYPRYKVLVEYDGKHHFEGEKQGHRDVDRLDELMEEEWRVVRVNRSHLARGATVVAKVHTALVARGWQP